MWHATTRSICQYKEILDVVFFLYPTVEDAKAGLRYGGTGFIVGIPTKGWPDQFAHHYAVTNWHVAVRDGASVVRLNTLDGNTDILEFGPAEWTFRPNFHDIAVMPLSLTGAHKFRALGPTFFLLGEEPAAIDVQVGDDTFMVGRFIDHDGVQTNRPAARFGHISMTGAPIRQPTGFDDDSIVVDLHSRTGFSGSPVFIYRTLGSEFLPAAKGRLLTGGGHVMKLLGIHWGQFYEKWSLKRLGKGQTVFESSLITDGEYVQGLSGMTCVCPSSAIWELLHEPEFIEQRANVERDMEKRLSPASSGVVAE